MAFLNTHTADEREKLAQAKDIVLFAVPAQLEMLTAIKRPFEGVRLLISAGSKLSPALRSKLEHSLPQAGIIECYGSSELSYIALSVPEHKAPPDSVGRPCQDVKVRIVDSTNNDLKQGEIGRILVDSPLRFLGYAAPNNQTSLGNMRSLDRYLDTGDTGYFDKEGFLYVTGRSDRMMLIAGNNVYPEQIEQHLSQVPALNEVAVFPEADGLRGQRPIALVQLHPTFQTTRQEIIGFAATQLPGHAIPRHYFHVPQWPRTVSGKTDLQKLRSLFSTGTLEPLT